MTEERRKSENTALRELVDALKAAIAARDGLWSLSVIDRLFRLEKYRQTIATYDDAMQRVRNSLQAVMATAKQWQPQDGSAGQKELEVKAGMTLEEFDFLLGKPGVCKKGVGKKSSM